MANLRTLPLRVLTGALLLSTALTAQQFAPKVRIVDRIDESNLVTLKGNTHPLANAKNDLGRVSPNLPMTDLILVLNRDPEQQAAFDQFVASQYDSSSPNFHHWLTPDQIGSNFGPSQTDIATVSSWLTGHGFSIAEVTKDGLSIRFSGTAAQVESAFHTEIHNLNAKGAAHIGNMSDPQIPAALAPVVVGVKALHNFFPKPLHHMGSTVSLNRSTGTWQRAADPVSSLLKLSRASDATASPSFSQKAHPEFTVNVPATGGSSGTPAYTEEDISPYDFATIYNILPLWNKGIDGTGQTIAIAGTSDISQNDISTFRTFFGLPTNIPANTPKMVHPNPNLPGGDDPGICTSTTSTVCSIDDLIENSLDVEWAGSIAKNAQLVLVTAASQSSTDDTLYDAESFVVNNVTAHILTVSYGECELGLGTSGNAEYNTLWQNAASEGIAVFVSAGDSGAASCDQGQDSSVPYPAEYGLSVSGIASTPYNTAVGGTDFNWCPFTSATACPAAPYWSTTNASNGASAVGYVPEMPWNNTCTNPFVLAELIDVAKANNISGVNNAETGCNFLADDFTANTSATALVDTVGGGGGMSNCTVSNGTTVASCTGGYTRPSWQTGVTGISGISGTTRLLPDVSFFASDGSLTDSAYLICVEENGSQPCTYSTDAEPFASEVGGTSASTPPMAGVMALINQKAGAAQGFANPELYKLAATQTYSSCSAETVTTSSSCLFNDIDANIGGTLGFSAPGTIAMACDATDSSPNCVASDSFNGTKDQIGILTGYNSGTGFDMATGLGSLNVANVVNGWAAVSGGTAVTVTVTPAQSSLSVTLALGVTGTVASSPTGGAAPTGTVTLTAGSYTSTATLSNTGGYSFTIPANSLGAGTDTINVAYGGNTTYSSGDGSATVTVNGSGATFSLTPTTPAAIAPGASATSTVTVAAVAGYVGSVTVTCSLTTAPTGATDAPNCTGGGSSLAVNLTSTNTSVPLTFTVTTTAPGTAELTYPNVRGKGKGWLGAGGGAVLAFLVFLGIPARRKSWRAMLGLVVLIAALGSLSACGGGGGGGGTTTTPDPGTSAGTYTFTVQGVGNPSVSPSVSATFTVTVN